eukprot:COSAG03_NODE_5939_length_1144_cov_10.716010_3_plen_188_part_00
MGSRGCHAELHNVYLHCVECQEQECDPPAEALSLSCHTQQLYRDNPTLATHCPSHLMQRLLRRLAGTTTTCAVSVSSRGGTDRTTSTTRRTTSSRCGTLTRALFSVCLSVCLSACLSVPSSLAPTTLLQEARAAANSPSPSLPHCINRWRYQQPDDLQRLAASFEALGDGAVLLPQLEAQQPAAAPV